MLNDEEMTTIEAVDLAPEVEQATMSLDAQQRELLCSKGWSTDERQAQELVAEVAPGEEQLEENSNTVRVPPSLSAISPELVPWDVQFTE